MNRRKLRIAIIGSGSSYLPDIGLMLMERKETLPVDELVLMDIDEYRLNCTGKYVANMLKEAGLTTQVTLTTDLEEACRNTNFVMTTIRVGMSDMRILDETIPQKYGFIGQETTPPGGLMMGLRNIPEMVKIAKTMERVAAPNAWMINLANPSGMMTEAVKKYSNINVVGLCNGPTVFRNLMAQYFKDEIDKPEDLLCMMSGINHILYGKVFVKGEDRTADGRYRMFHGWGEAQPFRIESMSMELQGFIENWIPMGPYNRYYYSFQEVINEQNADVNAAAMFLPFIKILNQRLGSEVLPYEKLAGMKTRAEFVKCIEAITLDLLGKGDPRGFVLAQNTRGGRDYGRAGVEMIDALWTGRRAILSPDVPSQGTLPGFNPEWISTTTSIVDATGVHPMVTDPLPPHLMAIIYAAKQYELQAIDAAMTGDYRKAMEALMCSTLINDFEQARKCLDEMLVAQKEYLPLFADAIARIERGENPLY